ncbi:MAG: universal stress protein [Dehalococcoidia bacterium]|nr:universal stress protein [Dehalococcoidia bacterium]
MAYQKVLVPLDGSELAERAIPYAKAIAKSEGSEIILFTVSTNSERLDRPMKAYLDVNAKELESQRIKVPAVTAYGNVAEEVIKFAEKHKVDLIIISTHGHSGIKRWMLGSVAEKILYGTSTPVLLIKSKAPKTSKVEFKKVLATLDGSAFAETSMPYVKELTKGTGGKVILLRICEPPTLSADRSPAIKPSWEEYRDTLMTEIKQQALEYLEKVKANFKTTPVKGQVVMGQAADGILEVAQKEKVDLIAMTTHGRTGVSRWVYGSVATRIVGESLQPILLIRPSVPKEPKI